MPRNRLHNAKRILQKLDESDGNHVVSMNVLIMAIQEMGGADYRTTVQPYLKLMRERGWITQIRNTEDVKITVPDESE